MFCVIRCADIGFWGPACAGPKEVAPTDEEIEALRAEQPIMLNVYFTDHSLKKFIVDDDL